MKIVCAHCGVESDKPAGQVNRSIAIGAPVYCGKVCAGLSRRTKNPPSDAERKEAKRLYDKEYRAKNRERIKAFKADYFQRTYDPEAAKVERAKRMPRHVEYCRQPEYRAKKKKYDKQRNEAAFADFAEAWRLLQQLEKEIRSQATAYERRVANGYYLRSAQRRRRELWKARKNSTQAI